MIVMRYIAITVIYVALFNTNISASQHANSINEFTKKDKSGTPELSVIVETENQLPLHDDKVISKYDNDKVDFLNLDDDKPDHFEVDIKPGDDYFVDVRGRPTERQIKIGDVTLKGVWDFCQGILREMDGLENFIASRQRDLVLTSYFLLGTLFKPSRALLDKMDVCESESLKRRINRYLEKYKTVIGTCKRTEYSRTKFQTVITSATEYLDQLQLKITKEVSLCEIIPPNEAEICFQKADNLAEKLKNDFRTESMAYIKQQAHEISDEIENYWLGCTSISMGEVKRANTLLVEKLKPYVEKTSQDCDHLEEYFGEVLIVKPILHEEDTEKYFLKYHGE